MSESANGVHAVPSQDQIEDVVFSARYGDLGEVQDFVQAFGIRALADARNDRGNGCLHMAAANGHDDVLAYLLPQLENNDLIIVNDSGNTPLHWAAMNGHTSTLEILVNKLPKSALFLKNQFGRTALSEAEAKTQAVVPAEAEEDKANSDAPQDPHQRAAEFLLRHMELEGAGDGKEDAEDGQGEVERTGPP